MPSKERRTRLLSGELDEEDRKGAADEYVIELLGYDKDQIQSDPILSRSIEKILDLLRPVEKFVLEKYFLQGKSFSEIGESDFFKATPQKVREIFYRALIKIKIGLRSLENKKPTGHSTPIYTVGQAIDGTSFKKKRSKDLI